jgi:hypothetical protein
MHRNSFTPRSVPKVWFSLPRLSRNAQSLRKVSLTPACRLRLKYDGTRVETGFRLSSKRTSPFKSAGGLQFSRLLAAELCASAVVMFSNAGYTTFRGRVKSTGYPLHSTVSPLLPLPCVTVCHHVSTGLYRTVCSRVNIVENVWKIPFTPSSKGLQLLYRFSLLRITEQRCLNSRTKFSPKNVKSCRYTGRDSLTLLNKAWLSLNRCSRTSSFLDDSLKVTCVPSYI